MAAELPPILVVTDLSPLLVLIELSPILVLIEPPPLLVFTNTYYYNAAAVRLPATSDKKL